MKKLFLILFLLTQSLTINAYISGAGAIDCKETVEYHTEYRELEDFLTSWMQGYISGIDTALEQDFARNVDADYLYLSVINRCKTRPDEYMHEAVEWVYINQL